MNQFLSAVALALAGLALSGCVKVGAPHGVAATTKPNAIDPSLPQVVAYRAPSCGCCEMWVEHMRAAGFDVAVRKTDGMEAAKSDAKVPAAGRSCHTALVGGYFVEGHVPAADIKRLLESKPDALGLTVPGMVVGSPGMDQGGGGLPYDVLLVARDGTTSMFAHHGP